MKCLFLLLSVVFITSCSGDSKGDKQPEDPIYGNWIYLTPGSNGERGVVGMLGKDGTITLLNFYGYVSGSSVVIYARKSIGTFVRTGDSFAVTYSYETCDPVGSETLNMKVLASGQLAVNVVDYGLFLTFNRATETNTALNVTGIEDINCNILSKLEKKEKRSVANVKKTKSFFDRVLK